MRRLSSRKTLTLLAAVLGLSAAPAFGATKLWDFNTDPVDEILFDATPTARWVENGGVTGGYLSITDAANSLTGTALFPDIDGGSPVTGFDLVAQLRIGGGSARPADGMSFSWIPVGGDTAFGDAAAEEGVVTGFTVSIDTWDNNGVDSAPSIEVDLDQRMSGIAYSSGQREGGRATFGTTNFDIQTGAAFVPLHIHYKNSFASVTYKGVDLIKNAYAPTTAEAKQLYVGARTGGANEAHWLDDLTLTTYTPAESYVNRVAPDPRLPNGMRGPVTLDSTVKGSAVVEVDIVDGTTTPLANGSVTMTFDAGAVTPNFVKNGNTTTVSFDPPGTLAPATKHTVSLTFPTGVAAATETITWEFWVEPITADTLFVEAEDLNYDSGQHLPAADSLTYAGAAYAGLSAVLGIDYNDPGASESAVYRTDVGIGMVGHPEVTRFDHDLTENFKVGWNDAGDWYNYTRVFPAGDYKIYGRHSSDGSDIATKLSLVNGATTDDQTTVDIGTFTAGESNGWDTFRYIALKDSAGNDTLVHLAGEQTVRITILPNSNEDINFLAFVPTIVVGGIPAIASISPGNGQVVNPNDAFTIIGSVFDQSVVVAANTLTMSINGTPVTDVAVKANGVSSITHAMPAPGFGATYNVEFKYTEGGVQKVLNAVVRSGGGVTRRLYTGLSTGQGLQEIYDSPQWNDNAPDVESVEPWYETPPNILEGYGMHLLGYIEPTVTGDYTFYMSSDDNGLLYLSTDEKAVNKRVIGRQVNWSGHREWTTDGGGNPVANRVSAPIHLIAGQRYYTEAIAKEGGGGDNLNVAWRRLGIDPAIVNGDPPITFEMRPFTGLEFDVLPASPVNVKQGVPIKLTTHAIAGPGGPITYEWLKDNVVVAGQTDKVLDLGAAAPAMSGTYKIRATLTPTAGGAAIVTTSPDIVITVTADSTPPAITAVTVVDLANILVRFDEPVPTAPTFTLSGGGTVVDAVIHPNPANNEMVWKVHTSILTPDTTYTLTATGAKDYALNTATVNKQFTPKLLQGYARWETFENIGGGTVANLTDNIKFQNDAPDQKAYRTEFQAPSDIMENFGTRLSGYFQPPSTGDYVFFYSSDDNGTLFLSTDEDPANKKAIAGENQWSGTREWVVSGNTGAILSDKRSDTFAATEWPTGGTITLTQGKRYYIESLSKEGGGGDNAGATWKLASAADPANGAASLQGAALAVVADPVISIATPVGGSSVTAGTATTITSTIQSSAGAAKVEYFANGTKLGESTTGDFSFIVPGPAIVPGLYQLTARITDTVGGTFTSVPSTIYVRPPASANAKKLHYSRASGGIFASDIRVVNRLFANGYDVYEKAANASTAADAADKAGVIISSTAASGDTLAKFKDVTVGVLSWEAAIQDDMRFTLNVDTVDRGTATGQTSLTITPAGAAHPIAAGIAAGDVVFATTGSDVNWGLPAASATRIATVVGQANQVGLYTFNPGDLLIDGVDTAKGRRVEFPMGDNTFNNLNAIGFQLFDQAVAWVIAGGTPTGPVLTVTRTAGVTTITWTGGGTLYSSPDLNGGGTFVTTGDSDGSYTVPTTDGAVRFYMVRVAP